MQTAPPREPEAPSAEPPHAAESPRRRSTVREPVPFITDEGPATYVAPSAPPPVAQEEHAHEAQPQEDAAKPRRTGWWSKRVLGG